MTYLPSTSSYIILQKSVVVFLPINTHWRLSFSKGIYCILLFWPKFNFWRIKPTFCFWHFLHALVNSVLLFTNLCCSIGIGHWISHLPIIQGQQGFFSSLLRDSSASQGGGAEAPHLKSLVTPPLGKMFHISVISLILLPPESFWLP